MGGNPDINNSIIKSTVYAYGESKLTKNYSSSTNYNCKKLLENLQSYQSKYPNSTHPLLAQSYIGNWTSDLGKIARKYILDHLSQEQYK